MNASSVKVEVCFIASGSRNEYRITLDAKRVGNSFRVPGFSFKPGESGTARIYLLDPVTGKRTEISDQLTEFVTTN